MSRIVAYRLKLGENDMEVPEHSHLVDAGMDQLGFPVAYYELLEDSENEDEEAKYGTTIFLASGETPFPTKQWAHFKTFLSETQGPLHLMTWYG